MSSASASSSATSGLKTLQAITTSTPLHFRTRASLLRRPLRFKHKLSFSLSIPLPRFSPLCSLCEGGNGSCLPNIVGEAVSGASPEKLLQVVLVSPQIPGNTGCIARTCAASAVGLHLVGPLGFQDGEKRLLAFTKRGTTIHSDFSYRRGDWLVFGSETSGLPPDVLLDCKKEAFGGGTVRIPMVETYVRCLNLSVSVGIALYEASRQLNYEQLQYPSEPRSSNGDESFIVEDIFA